MLCKNLDDLIENGVAGDWCFAKNDTVLWLRYPTKDENDFLPIVHLNVTPSQESPCWNFDGNKEAPTLSPSIRIRGGHKVVERWHGFLRNGKLITV